MKIDFFSAKPYDKEFFNRFNQQFGFEIQYHETHLGPHSINLVTNSKAVCVFVNDILNASIIEALAGKGIKMIALRCAGFNNVDMEAAKKYNIAVTRVAAYSP